MRRPLARLVAAAVTAAAASLGVGVATAPPAAADGCSGSSGVTVVVDRGSLGGGISQVCNGSSGGNAASLFTGSGFSLTYVQRQPGFVCRIDGVPASDPCVVTPPADAYWGLWWSDGKSGSWSYSSLGAGSLSVPEGGYVAFAWQSGSKTAPGVPATPRAAPANPAPSSPSSTPSASAKPTKKPSSKPTPKPTPTAASTPAGTPAPTSAASSTAAPDQTSAAASSTATPTPTTSPTEDVPASATATPSEPVDTTDPSTFGTETPAGEASEVDGAGTLPVWSVPVVLVLLVAGGATTYLLRRRHRPRP